MADSPRTATPASPRSTLLTGIHGMRVIRGAEWDGVAVEVVHASRTDCVIEPSAHVVTVHLQGSAELLQARHGRSVSRRVTRGEVIITPAGAAKHWRAEEPRQWLAVRLPAAYLDTMLPGERHRGIALLDNFGTRDPVIEGIARNLAGELERPGVASDVYGSALVHELGVHLLRHYSGAPTAAPPRAASLPEHKLRRARDFIDAHLAEVLSVGRIAREVAMSPHHFAHVFQSTTGQSPHSFVIERRMERAKLLLHTTELPITEVAHQVGCPSPSHFSVLFRQRAGVSPSAFRRAR